LSKLPVIATNVGEIKEVILNGKTGFLIESNDVFNFSNKLIYLINNPHICVNFAEELNKHVNVNYSKKAVIHNYLNQIY
jgi:glycosyltransferase involved in cell wall biosynthesis